jgi:hypothetical protein
VSQNHCEVASADDVLAFAEKRREKLGLSLRGLAESAGYGHAAYWWWVKRNSRISLDAALAYLKVMGVSVVLTTKD